MNLNQHILNFFKANATYVIVYFIFMLAFPITAVFLPKYYGKLLDNIKNEEPLQYKTILCLLILTNIMYITLDSIDAVFIPKLQSFIRTNIVKIILEGYKDRFEEQEVGILISKIIKLPMVTTELFHAVRNYIMPLLFIIVMVLIRFTIINKKLGIATTIGVLSAFIVIIPLSKTCIRIASETDEEADISHEDIAELFENLMDIYSMDTYDKEMKLLEEKQKIVINRYKKSYNISNSLRIFTNLFFIIFFISISGYAYNLYTNDKLILDDLVNVVLTSKYVISKVGSFTGEIPELIFNIGIYLRTQEYLLKLKKEHKVNNNITEEYNKSNSIVNYQNVSIKYNNKYIIKNFNLTIYPNESVAIIGKIGTGKSSLVKCLLKLAPYEGDIYFQNENIKTLDSSDIRSSVLFIRQNPLPFNRSLYDMIVYGNVMMLQEKMLYIYLINMIYIIFLVVNLMI